MTGWFLFAGCPKGMLSRKIFTARPSSGIVVKALWAQDGFTASLKFDIGKLSAPYDRAAR
jgi:hypothetical protein